jgi:hypothetical protein
MIAILIIVCLVSACLLWQFGVYMAERPARIRREYLVRRLRQRR